MHHNQTWKCEKLSETVWAHIPILSRAVEWQCFSARQPHAKVRTKRTKNTTTSAPLASRLMGRRLRRSPNPGGQEESSRTGALCFRRFPQETVIQRAKGGLRPGASRTLPGGIQIRHPTCCPLDHTACVIGGLGLFFLYMVYTWCRRVGAGIFGPGAGLGP